MTSPSAEPPFALFIRGSKNAAFEISDQLGFDTQTEALAISIFEDGLDTMHVQALFETEAQAQSCLGGLKFPEDMECFITQLPNCLLYTSPSPRDATLSRMPSSA